MSVWDRGRESSRLLRQAVVLVVEDNPADAELLRLRLKRIIPQGRFVHAMTMTEAKSTLMGTTPDVIFMDLGLPDGEGVMSVSQLVRAAPESTLIVLTGLNDEAMALEALGHGAQDYLLKGRLDVDLLKRALSYAMARREALKLHSQIERERRLSALGQVVGALAHQLNNPAGVVLSNAQMLDMILDDGRDALAAGDLDGVRAVFDEIQECFHDVTYGAQRIGEVIKSISSYTSGVLELATDTKIVRSVEQAIRKLTRELPENIAVELDFRADALVRLPPERLVQVIEAVVTNAIESMQDPERQHVLRVSTMTSETHITISVSDTGDGVPASLGRRIFKPFFTSKEKHVGLGLTLAHEIVRSFDGEIHMHLREGRGTRFDIEFLLPKVARDEAIVDEFGIREAGVEEITEVDG